MCSLRYVEIAIRANFLKIQKDSFLINPQRFDFIAEKVASLLKCWHNHLAYETQFQKFLSILWANKPLSNIIYSFVLQEKKGALRWIIRSDQWSLDRSINWWTDLSIGVVIWNYIYTMQITVSDKRKVPKFVGTPYQFGIGHLAVMGTPVGRLQVTGFDQQHLRYTIKYDTNKPSSSY